MAVTTTDVNNGDTGAVARAAINSNDKALAVQGNSNETRLNGMGVSASGLLQDTLKLDTTLANPTYQEGLVFYDKDKKAVSYYNDESGTIMHIGQAMFLRVYNNSGGLISKGDVVRHAGVFSGVPAIQLAIATSFEAATILGVAGHSIENGTYGYVVFGGEISELDTSLLTVGLPVYLSDTIPGGLTSTAPDIVSQVGGILVSNASTGALQVVIRNTRAFPIIGAFFQNTVTPISVTATPTEFNNFTTSSSLLIDISSGNSFRVPTGGVYTGTFTVSMSNITASSSGHIIFIELYDKTTTTVLYTYNMIVGRSDTVGSSSFSAPIVLLANDDLSIRYWSTTAVGAAVSVDGISMSIESRQL